MRPILTFFCFTLISNCYCQYFFNDIVSTRETNERFKLLRTHKIKKIKATSFEADNSITAGFFLEEEISMDGKKSQLNTILSGGKQSISNRTYESGKIKRTQTTSNKIETRTDYTYNEKGQLQKLQFSTSDTSQKSNSGESHEWFYAETGQLQSMLRIKNKIDTTTIELVNDEKGLVIEERWKKKNRTIETYYYYYDNKNQLTDIVRYNTKLKKLLPDYLYEYDTGGRISQMTSISMTISNYIIWKYTYSEKGLKQLEIGFDKEKKLMGRIEFTYE
jgi:hypothetical protein